MEEANTAAVQCRRFSEGTSADREIQRTLMELLSQLDGFDPIGKVRSTACLRPRAALDRCLADLDKLLH